MIDIAKEAQRFAEATSARLWREKYLPQARAAAEEEATRRAEHFVDAPRAIGPWLLRPLTLRDVLLCEGFENPLLAPAEVAIEITRPEQLWWFAWLLQPVERHGDAEAREAFLAAATLRHFEHRPRRRLLRRAVLESTGQPSAAYFADLAAVVEYVSQHFADAGFSQTLDPKTGRPRPARDTGTHWIAGIVDTLAAEYAWREADVLDLHLGRVWQYLRRIEFRRDPQALIPSREKKLRGECTAEVERLTREHIAALTKPSTTP